MEYKSPKLRLKKRKKESVEPMAEESELGGSVSIGKEKKLSLAKIPGKKMGKTIIRKSKGISEPNIIDARSETREVMKEGLEKERLKRERELYKKLLKMK